MGQVALSLNGRTYRLACGAGEEERLKLLATYVKEKLEKLSGEFGQIGEARLMLMGAILIADELLDARAERDAAAEAAADLLEILGEKSAPDAVAPHPSSRGGKAGEKADAA